MKGYGVQQQKYKLIESFYLTTGRLIFSVREKFLELTLKCFPFFYFSYLGEAGLGRLFVGQTSQVHKRKHTII